MVADAADVTTARSTACQLTSESSRKTSGPFVEESLRSGGAFGGRVPAIHIYYTLFGGLVKRMVNRRAGAAVTSVEARVLPENEIESRNDVPFFDQGRP